MRVSACADPCRPAATRIAAEHICRKRFNTMAPSLLPNSPGYLGDPHGRMVFRSAGGSRPADRHGYSVTPALASQEIAELPPDGLWRTRQKFSLLAGRGARRFGVNAPLRGGRNRHDRFERIRKTGSKLIIASSWANILRCAFQNLAHCSR